jgi:hypothetical protein
MVSAVLCCAAVCIPGVVAGRRLTDRLRCRVCGWSIVCGGVRCAGTPLASRFSPTLFVFAAIHVLSYAYSIYDCVLTFRGTTDRTKPLDWEWQHECFKRMCIPLAVDVLFVIPEIFTFVLQSRGDEFFVMLENLQSSDPNTFSKLVLHIVSFGTVIIFFVIAQGLINYTVNNGLFGKDRRATTTATGPLAAQAASPMADSDLAIENLEAQLLTPNSSLAGLMNKVTAIVGFASLFFYSASLIIGCATETNSGIIIFTIIFIAPALATAFMCLQLLFRSSAKLSKNWWLTFRSITAVRFGCGWHTARSLFSASPLMILTV